MGFYPNTVCLPSLILPIFESQRIFVFRLQSQLRTRCFAINEMWTHLYLQKSTPISCECKKHNWSVKAASFNCFISWFCSLILGLPQWLREKESCCAGDSEDVGSIPGWGRSPGRGHGNLLRCSCLKNPMDRGAWWAVVHGVSELKTTEETAQQPRTAWSQGCAVTFWVTVESLQKM